MTLGCGWPPSWHFTPTPSIDNPSWVQSKSLSSLWHICFSCILFSLTAVKCSELHMDTAVAVNCSNPWGNFSYGSTCTFQCPEGQSLNGSVRSTCQEDGHWSDDMPTCQGTVFKLGLKHQLDPENRILVSFPHISHGRISSPCWFPLFDECFTMSHRRSLDVRQSPRDEAAACGDPCHSLSLFRLVILISLSFSF